MPKDLSWISQSFAHRGLHNTSKGIIENSPSAIQAAIDQGYGIEVDLRQAACGTILVFHDERLDRLTHETGVVSNRNLEDLQQVRFRDTNDKMMSLRNLLDLVGGRVPMLLEIKSNWQFDETGRRHFVKKIMTTLKDYQGHFAVMSFDPSIVRTLRDLAPSIPRGLISEQFKDLKHWQKLSFHDRLCARFLLSFARTRPDFIAYDINALPAIAPIIARILFQKPLLTWTVRTKQQQQRAAKYCDAMIFESFLPTNKKTDVVQ